MPCLVDVLLTEKKQSFEVLHCIHGLKKRDIGIFMETEFKI